MSNFFLKRTTLIVENAINSIAFYKNVLGMHEYYNQKMSVGGKIIPAGDPNAKVHLGIMEGGHPSVGKLGLLEWCAPRLEEKPLERDRTLSIGKAFFQCQIPNIQILYSQLQNSPYCLVYREPYNRVIPERPGGKNIKVKTLSFFDNDGFFFEVNQPISSVQCDVFNINSTTIIVENMEVSVAFYTEILGMEVCYDCVSESSANFLPIEGDGGLVRYVILKCGTSETGMLGVLQYLNPLLESPPAYEKYLKQGQIIFVSGTENLSLLNSRISNAQEATKAYIHCAPQFDQVRDASGTIVNLTTMSFFDPDGFFYELNMRESVSR